VIGKKEELFFRDRGIVGLAGKEPVLKDKWFFLKELLQKEMH
jgi:hypothetical protein